MATIIKAAGTPKASGKQVSCPSHSWLLKIGVKNVEIKLPALIEAYNKLKKSLFIKILLLRLEANHS